MDWKRTLHAMALWVTFLVGLLGVTTIQPTYAQTPESVDVTLIRSGDTLTVYIPYTGVFSIERLTFTVVNADGKTLEKPLNGFPALKGLDLSRLVGPICIYLRGTTRTGELPLDCQAEKIQLITQRLSAADMIWWDSIIASFRIVSVTDGSAEITQCQFPDDGSTCTFSYRPPTISIATNPAPVSPTFEVKALTGEIQVTGSTPFYAGPGPQYERIATITAGTYEITGISTDEGYYRVTYQSADAWVSSAALSIKVKLPLQDTNQPTAIPDVVLKYGGSTSGELERKQKLLFKFVGLKNEIVSLEIITDFDACAALLAPNGQIIAEDCNSGPNGTPQIRTARLPENGEYRIELRGYSPRDSGSFDLTLYQGDIPEGQSTNDRVPRIRYGRAYTDTLEANDEIFVEFEGKEGEVISIEVDAAFDITLQLIDPANEIISQADVDGGDETTFLEDFKLETTGIYQIAVRGKSFNDAGQFTLLVAQGNAPGQQLVIEYAQTLDFEMEANRPTWINFLGQRGDRVNVTVSCGFDSRLSLRDQSGKIVAENDDATVDNIQPELKNIILAKSGDYTIVIAAKDAESSGKCQLMLTRQ